MSTGSEAHSKSSNPLKNLFIRLSRGVGSREEDGLLGDFTVTRRVIPISALAVVIGVACAYVSLILLRLIGLFSILFYFHRWSFVFISPAHHLLGYWALLVPILG